MIDATTIQGIRVPLSAMRFHEPKRDRYPTRARYDSRQVILAALISANVVVYGYIALRLMFG